jgi:hypothetical protein
MMLRGRRLYADFFEFIPPGSYLITAAWFGVAGASIESARALAMLVIVGIASFAFLACRQASRNAPLSAALAIAWVMTSQWHWMQVSHHWFASLFSMIAAWAALASLERVRPHSLQWPSIAGLAAGTATVIMQTCGAWITLAAGTAFISLHRNRSELVAYLLAIALAPVCVLAFLVKQEALAAAFDDVIRFAVTSYASIQGVPFGYGTSIFDYPLKYVFPLTASLLLAVIIRDRRERLLDPRLRLCAALALAGFLGCFPRPDIAHIGFCAPLTLPLFALVATRLFQPLRTVVRYTIIVASAGLFSPAVVSFASIAFTAYHAQTVPTARGNVAFLFAKGLPELVLRIAEIPPHAGFFFYPYMPMLPFLVAREHVSKYDVFVPGYTTQAQYEEACLSAVRHASWAVTDRKFEAYSYWKQAYPSMPDAEPLEAIRFRQALDRAFVVVAREGDFELRSRSGGASDAVCNELSEAGGPSSVASRTKPATASPKMNYPR